MEDKRKRGNTRDVGEDISPVPDDYIDITVHPLMGGFWTRPHVEIAEEDFLDEDVKNTINREKIKK